MATAQTQALRDILDPPPNEPVEIALKYPTGKPVHSVHGQRVMFTLADERVMFLDLGPAQKINALRVKPGEPFYVCVKWSGKRGDPKDLVVWLSPEAEKRRAQAEAIAAGDTWTAKKLDRSIHEAQNLKAGVQANGTLVVPGDGEAIVRRAKAHAAGETSKKLEPRPARTEEILGQRLLGRTNILTDAYAGALKYAYRHGDQVKPEDVRWFVIAAFLGEGETHGA